MATRRFHESPASGIEQAYEGELLHAEDSAFQHIEVYEHPAFGRMLVLDGAVQTSERDEFCYHEMLVHLPLLCHANPRRVLVIGGGDGGTLRHVLMHGTNAAVMCEIDEAVVRVSREHLPALAGRSFDDARTKLVIDDGAAFVARCKDAFDAIIVDSTDPFGAAEVLFGNDFYESCKTALRAGGVIVSQTGSPYYQPDEFRRAVANMSSVFATVEPYIGFVPTYPGVVWSYTVATDGTPVSASPADEIRSRLETRGVATRLYTPELHRGIFALPSFVRTLAATARVSPVPGR